MTPRKTWLWREIVHRDGDVAAARPVTRVVMAMAVRNPFSGHSAHDLSALEALGPVLVERYLPEAVTLLPGPVVAYGKAAIVGSAGEVEHGAALLHPRLGKPCGHWWAVVLRSYLRPPRSEPWVHASTCRWVTRTTPGISTHSTR